MLNFLKNQYTSFSLRTLKSNFYSDDTNLYVFRDLLNFSCFEKLSDSCNTIKKYLETDEINKILTLIPKIKQEFYFDTCLIYFELFIKVMMMIISIFIAIAWIYGINKYFFLYVLLFLVFFRFLVMFGKKAIVNIFRADVQNSISNSELEPKNVRIMIGENLEYILFIVREEAEIKNKKE